MSTLFLSQLKEELPGCNAMQRQNWVKHIVKKKIPLSLLTPLLLEKRAIALPFSWLLSGIAKTDSATFNKSLPQLYAIRKEVTTFDFEQSFATYWGLAGVPIENEADAIDLLFKLLQSANVNVTTKSRALIPLTALTQKYPELKNELRECLEVQQNNSTAQFKKRAQNLLNQLK